MTNDDGFSYGSPREAADEEIRELSNDDPKVYGYVLYMSPWQPGVLLTARRYKRTEDANAQKAGDL